MCVPMYTYVYIYIYTYTYIHIKYIYTYMSLSRLSLSVIGSDSTQVRTQRGGHFARAGDGEVPLNMFKKRFNNGSTM